MKVIEFPDKMDVLLGKVAVGYLSYVNIVRDDLRVVQAMHLVSGLVKPPAVVHSVSDLDFYWPKVLELLEKGEIGLVISVNTARRLYQKTGRKADYVILYGSEGFWNIVVERVERYGMNKQRFRAFVEMFGRHMATLRFFWEHDLGILLEYKDYTEGKIDRKWFEPQFVNMLLDVYAYENYPVPEDLKEAVLTFMMRNNATVLKEAGDPLFLFELDNPVEIQIENVFEDEKEAEEIYRVLSSLHPKAVERKDRHTVVVKLMF